jgi:hypothetical protein
MSWITLECGLDDHEKIAGLPGDAARYGWVRTLLEAKLQRHPGTFASAKHFRHVMGRHGRYLPAYLAAGLLEEMDGRLTVHDWQRHQWAGTKAHQRETLGGPAKDKPRTNGGPEQDPSRAVPVPVYVSVLEEGVQGEAAVFAFLAQHGAAIRPDAPLGRRLYGLMDRRGADVVLKEAEQMATVENVMSDRQWVLGLENGLEAIPSGRKSADDAVEEEAKVRSDVRYDRMVTRRLEWFRSTGKWDEAWGPEPAV